MKTFTLTFVLCLAATSVSAQQQSALPAPMPVQPAAPLPTQPAATPQLAARRPPAIPVGTRVGEMPTGYDAGGRRDPFFSLIAPKRVAASSGGVNSLRPRSGLASIALADVTGQGHRQERQDDAGDSRGREQTVVRRARAGPIAGRRDQVD